MDKLREKTINNRGSVDMDSLEQQAEVLGNCSRGIAEQKGKDNHHDNHLETIHSLKRHSV